MTVRLNLPKPDITLIAGMADYPAAIVHPDAGSADSFPGTVWAQVPTPWKATRLV